jgi:hypothetical protein
MERNTDGDEKDDENPCKTHCGESEQILAAAGSPQDNDKSVDGNCLFNTNNKSF